MPKYVYKGDGVFRYGSIAVSNGDVITATSKPNKLFQEVITNPPPKKSSSSSSKKESKKESKENE